MFAPERACCAVIHTLTVDCASLIRFVPWADRYFSVILWYSKYSQISMIDSCRSCHLSIYVIEVLRPFLILSVLFSNFLWLFPFPSISRKHSWASGSEASPWLAASSVCGFAVEDAAGIASCTSTNPGKSYVKLQTSHLIIASCMFSQVLLHVLCIELWSNHLIQESLQNNRTTTCLHQTNFVLQSFKRKIGSLIIFFDVQTDMSRRSQRFYDTYKYQRLIRNGDAICPFTL